MSTVKRYTGNLTFEGLTANSVVSFGSNSSLLISGDLEVQGNTTLSGNISGDSLNSGTTSIGIPTPNGNANITVGGVSNVFVVSTAGAAVTGNLAISGTLTAGAFAPSSLSVAGNVSGSNVNAAGNVLVTQDASANTPTVRLTDSNTAATANTVIGSYEWFANDASAPGARTVAAIRANTVDTAGNVRVDILTGNSATLIQRFSVLPNGNVGIANTVPDHVLSINGAVYVGNHATVIGNVTGGNVATAGQVSATANVTGGNLLSSGQVSATGNIVGGNLSMSGSAAAASLSISGNVIGGNVSTGGVLSATGNATAANFVTAGLISASGTVTGGSLEIVGTANAGNLTGGTLSVTGAITGGATVSVPGNITGGNVSTAGRVSATGNVVTGGFFIGDGSQLTNVTAASNVTVSTIANGTTSMQVLGSGGNIIANVNGTVNVAQFSNAGLSVSALTAAGNVTGGNLGTTGIISAGGNVSAGNVTANTGSFATVVGNANATALTTGTVPSARLSGSYSIDITGIAATANTVSNAAQPNITSLGSLTTLTVVGNASAGNITTSGSLGVTGNLVAGNINTAGTFSLAGNVTASQFNGSGAGLSSIPAANITGSVPSATTAGTVTTAAQPNITSVGNLTSVSVIGNVNTGNLITGGLISATGNITAGNILGGANVNATTHTGATASLTGNVTAGNLITGGLISATGNITAGNLSVANGTVSLNNIVNNGANATGNIGSSTGYFNRVFATATTALYADLAEYYRADQMYDPGTVLVFDGEDEVTQSHTDNDHRVAGVVSTDPAYVMNAALPGPHTVAVALQGRVPVKVFGPVHKGDLMVAAVDGHAQANNQARAGTILGKSLENFLEHSGVIEIAVGRS